MKLSDYVIQFLEGITDSVFLLSGGTIMHLVDSLGKSNKLKAYCCHHEQAAAIAAEGYARIKNNIGVCMVMNGPGGANVITGVAGAWLDSIPMLVISGQVKRDNIVQRVHGVPTVRSIGFQELNLVDIVKPITKYAILADDQNDIRYHLEKAIYLAKTGRPGPVWIDIPIDVQAEEIDPYKLRSFTPPPDSQFATRTIPINLIVEKLEKAKKPLLLVGNGVRLAGGRNILNKLVEKIKINVVNAMFTSDDLINHGYSYYLGKQGVSGNKEANYALDNCDLLLVVGDRLQLSQTSFEYHNFAKNAFKIMVDIDPSELHKKTLNIDLPICIDAKSFLEELNKQSISLNRWNIKIKKINPDDYKCNKNYLNVYRFIEKLGKFVNNYPVTTSNGMAKFSTHQALALKDNQRIITNCGLRPMGSALPMSVGACIANGKKPTICMEGDGSIMLNIQEIETIIYHKLPIKIFIFNNNGYSSIRNTHLKYFNKIFAADPGSGVGIPNFERLMLGWGIKYIKIAKDEELNKLKEVLDCKEPMVCELMLDPHQKMLTKWSAGEYQKI